VDLERGTLTVHRNLVGTRNLIPRFGEPTSHTSRRTIFLPSSEVHVLKAHKARQAQDQLAADSWAVYDLVFCSHIGTPLLRRNVLRAFKQALHDAGLSESIHFHDLASDNDRAVSRQSIEQPLKRQRGSSTHHIADACAYPGCTPHRSPVRLLTWHEIAVLSRYWVAAHPFEDGGKFVQQFALVWLSNGYTCPVTQPLQVMVVQDFG